MICIDTVKRFCYDYEQIENYKQAIKDSKMWHCHHRKEIDNGVLVSKEELIKQGCYFDVNAEDLIFLPASVHRKLHGANVGIKAREKLSKASKGRKIKADTWYTLERGKFIEAKEEDYE